MTTSEPVSDGEGEQSTTEGSAYNHKIRRFSQAQSSDDQTNPAETAERGRRSARTNMAETRRTLTNRSNKGVGARRDGIIGTAEKVRSPSGVTEQLTPAVHFLARPKDQLLAMRSSMFRPPTHLDSGNVSSVVSIAVMDDESGSAPARSREESPLQPREERGCGGGLSMESRKERDLQETTEGL